MATTTETIGQGIAGALIATSLFRTLTEKGILTAEEAIDVLNHAISAVKNSVSAEERAALRILKGLHRQLHSWTAL